MVIVVKISNNGSIRTRIMGMGKGVPDRILSNADFEKMVDTTDEWITTRTGIKRRHVVETGVGASELATIAALQAIEEANIDPKEIDKIILGTVTGDMKFPSTASLVQANIGAVNAAAYDISAACSGFIFGLQLADMYISTGQGKYVLVIGVEIMSSMTDYTDRSTCILFGDGAGAAVVGQAEDEPGILSTHTGSDGNLMHLLYCEGGGSLFPAKDRDIPKEKFTLQMKGNEVFKHAVRAMGEASLKALELANLTPGDIDLLVPHQANIRIIDAISKRLKLDKDKVYVNIHEYGNTSAASIPIALTEARENGLIVKGSKVLCVAFGAGFTWASCILQF